MSATNETSALAAIAAAEESLRQVDQSNFNDLRSYAKPPLACLAIFEAINILLDPSKEVSDWDDDKKLMSGKRDDFLQRIFSINKDNINDKQLSKLKAVLNRDDCQQARLEQTSNLCAKLGIWLRAVAEYASQRQQTH